MTSTPVAARGMGGLVNTEVEIDISLVYDSNATRWDGSGNQRSFIFHFHGDHATRVEPPSANAARLLWRISR
jgi:hypothetical protein